MSDSRGLPRHILAEFIEIYHANPCLWETDSKYFRNKNKKNEAYQLLVDKLAEVDPEADKGAVLRKINSIRTCFRKENRKVLKCKKLGVTHVPTLWYYERLKFLLSEVEPRTSMMRVQDNVTVDNMDSEESQCEILTIPEKIKTQSETTMSDLTRARIASLTASLSKRQMGDIIPKNHEQSHPSKNPKKYDSFGQHIAEKLREMSNEEACHVTKIINDAIYHAQRRMILKLPRINSVVSLKVEENGSYIDDN